MSGPYTRKALTPDQKLRMVYHRMVQSCTDQNHESYRNYGARGVYVNKADWPTSDDFVAWAWVSGYVADAGLSIDRIDSAGPYSVDNCRWADRKTQQRNMSVNRRYTYLCQELTAGEILELYQGSYTDVERSRLSYRLKTGWSVEMALTLTRQQNGIKRARLERHKPSAQQKYEFNGEYYTAASLIRHFQGDCTTAQYGTFFRRLKQGWKPVQAASTRPRSPVATMLKYKYLNTNRRVQRQFHCYLKRT